MFRRFAGFALVGVIAAAVNIAFRVVISEYLLYEIAVLVAYPVGLTVAFILNRAFVFRQKSDRVSRQYQRFALVNIIALSQVWIVSVGLSKLAFPWIGLEWHADLIAHLIGVGSPILSSYFAYKYFVFRPTDRAA
jgi:putative flippase GtrA